MKSRLALLVFLLVVLPTAVLSILAGVALQGWESVLERQLAVSANQTAETVVARLDTLLVDNLRDAEAALSGALARGGKFWDLDTTCKRLAETRPVVHQCLVYMDPWGLVHPAEGTGQGPTVSRADLVAALRKAVADPEVSKGVIRLHLDKADYVFMPLRARRGHYGGFEVDPAGVRSVLQTMVLQSAGETLFLQASGPGYTVPDMQDDEARVVVEDSLGGGASRTQLQAQNVTDLSRAPLASVSMPPPLDRIRIKVYARDPQRLHHASRVHARMYAWGILLLAGGILCGTWVVFHRAAVEIQDAKSRSDFVMGVSHDLRTPISSMKILAESLHQGRVKDEAKQRRFLETIASECDRLSQLIERVLFLVRFGQNALNYLMRPCDVGEVVARVVHQYSGKQAAGLDIRSCIEPNLPVVRADDNALSQVFLNLLDNAAKYGRPPPGEGVRRTTDSNSETAEDGAAPPNGRRVVNGPLRGGLQAEADEGSTIIDVSVDAVHRRRVLWRPSRDWVRVIVQDYGRGMTAAERKHIFRKFYRAQHAVSSNVSGVGLGLALCRHIVSRHGGWIDVESEPGKGSTFSVLLPAEVLSRRRHDAERRRTKPTTKNAKGTKAEPGSRAFSPIRDHRPVGVTGFALHPFTS
jgi:signal transduction histidine kinase